MSGDADAALNPTLAQNAWKVAPLRHPPEVVLTLSVGQDEKTVDGSCRREQGSGWIQFSNVSVRV